MSSIFDSELMQVSWVLLDGKFGEDLSGMS